MRKAMRTTLIRACLTASLLVSTLVLGDPRAATPATRQANAGTFHNPILQDGADPFAFYFDGSFYLTCTRDREVDIWKSPTIEALGKGAKFVAWAAPSSGPMSRHIWAPEVHQIGGRFYIYFAADDGNDASHRMYVLQGTDQPIGPYVVKGKVADGSDQWAIDGTVFQKRDGMLYMIWSGWPRAPGPQNLYIAPMSNPWTISGKRVEISSPTLPWERHGWPVNEAPKVLCHDGKFFVVYSASGATTRYHCLGMLSNTDGDLLNPGSWVKSPRPVFCQYSGPDGTVYAPGHCSLLRSPDGKEDWIFYHAKDADDGRWDTRSTRAQKFTWTAAGLPDFGHPIPPGVPLAPPSGERGRLAG